MLAKVIVLFIQWIVVLGQQADFYGSNPNIYELTPSNFDKVVHKSNYTTIVEFYAPWCGYCQQLKSSFSKLGDFVQKDSKYAINVAAVNCDKAYNKPLCSEYQVTGFPTLKVFRPPKYNSNNKPTGPTRHAVETYTGKRSFKPILQFLTSRIKNYTRKIHLIEGINKWIKQTDDYRYKVFVVTNSKTVSPLLKTLAIDFLDSVKFGVYFKETGFEATIHIDGEDVKLPMDESESAPIIMLIDTKTKNIIKYNGKKTTEKHELSKWITKHTGHSTIEGELSKKDIEYYSNYRIGKKGKKIIHDEL